MFLVRTIRRRLVSMFAVALLLMTGMAVIGIFGGGSYMGERFSTGSRDFGGRVAHWALGRSMLTTPDTAQIPASL